MPNMMRELFFEVPLMPKAATGLAQRPFQPLPTHDLLMEAVLRYRLLTNEQLTRLFYKPGMLTTVITRTKQLREAGYLQPLYLSSQSVFGGAATVVYTLARDGLTRMKAAGYRVPARYHPKELARLARNSEWVRGRLAENDVLISLELLCTHVPAIRLLPPPEHFQASGLLLHEYTLRQHAPSVTLTTGPTDEPRTQQRTVTFDGWARLDVTTSPAFQQVHGTNGYEQSIALEIDRDTEEQRTWRTKVAAIVALAESSYQDHFGHPSFVVAVVVVPTTCKLILPLGAGPASRQPNGTASLAEVAQRRASARVAELRHWTAAELHHLTVTGRTRLSQAELARLFCFTAADPTRLAPADLWLTARWHEPFAPEPVAILEDVADFPA